MDVGARVFGTEHTQREEHEDEEEGGHGHTHAVYSQISRYDVAVE